MIFTKWLKFREECILFGFGSLHWLATFQMYTLKQIQYLRLLVHQGQSSGSSLIQKLHIAHKGFKFKSVLFFNLIAHSYFWPNISWYLDPAQRMKAVIGILQIDKVHLSNAVWSTCVLCSLGRECPTTHIYSLLLRMYLLLLKSSD